MQLSAQCFLALIAMDGMYACIAGAKKQVAKTLLFLKAPFQITRAELSPPSNRSARDYFRH
jgi:hypothetical protein